MRSVSIMNRPPIKQKPIIGPKQMNRTNLNVERRAVNLESTEIPKSDLKQTNETKPIETSESVNSSKKNDDSKVNNSQQLDDLNKAFQLLNKSSLAEKDENHYDIRIDEDQIEICNRIVQNLSEAGYLRANIIGLSEFDKIIGGMCWCIELCNIDIDIDLFYQDTLTIGQKIALTEKIIKVLTIMKCPHQIEAHQIQGLDCVNILPVVEWLIKESREFSAHIKDYNDMFAAWKFDCDHGLHKDKEDFLVISRSKEVKKIIKEYFNKNEIKIKLKYKVDQYEKELENVHKTNEQWNEESEELSNLIESKETEIEQIESECITLAEQLIEHQSAEKKQLIGEYSRLVDELKQLKSTNRLTKNKMKKDYESLLQSTTVGDHSDLLHQLELEKTKLYKIKTQLADKNKNYLMLRRRQDSLLSKEEMSQYQKRFIELSAQVSSKLNETKKFYILYNQLESTKKQLENKFLFFESLLKCYSQLDPSSKNSPINQQFTLQLEQKINSLNVSLMSLRTKNQSKLQRKKTLEQQNVELIEMKRLYYKYVKELKEEMMNAIR